MGSTVYDTGLRSISPGALPLSDGNSPIGKGGYMSQKRTNGIIHGQEALGAGRIDKIFKQVMKVPEMDGSPEQPVVYDLKYSFEPPEIPEYTEADVKRAVKKAVNAISHAGVFLWPTQVAAAYTAFTNPIQNVPTGQGKTFIAAAQAISASYLSKGKYGIRIITSNPYLALEGLKQTAHMYENAGLKAVAAVYEDGFYKFYSVKDGEIVEVAPQELVERRDDGSYVSKAHVIYMDEVGAGFRKFAPTTKVTRDSRDGKSFIRAMLPDEKIAESLLLYSDRFLHILDESDLILLDSVSNPSVKTTTKVGYSFSEELKDAYREIAEILKKEIDSMKTAPVREIGSYAFKIASSSRRDAIEQGFAKTEDEVLTDGGGIATKYYSISGYGFQATEEFVEKVAEILRKHNLADGLDDYMAYGSVMEGIILIYELLSKGLKNKVMLEKTENGKYKYHVLTNEGRPMMNTHFNVQEAAAAVLEMEGYDVCECTKNSGSSNTVPKINSVLSPIGNIMLSGTNSTRSMEDFSRKMGWPDPIDIMAYREYVATLGRRPSMKTTPFSQWNLYNADGYVETTLGGKKVTIPYTNVVEKWKEYYGQKPTRQRVYFKKFAGLNAFNTVDESAAMIAERAREISEHGRSMLVISHDADAARKISDYLKKHGFDVELLSSDNVMEEDRLYEKYGGKRGKTLVALRIIGRGVDIKPDVPDEKGGMHVVIHGIAHARALMQELGRVGRGIHAGTYEFLVDVETADRSGIPTAGDRVYEIMELLNEANKYEGRKRRRKEKQALEKFERLANSIDFKIEQMAERSVFFDAPLIEITNAIDTAIAEQSLLIERDKKYVTAIASDFDSGKLVLSKDEFVEYADSMLWHVARYQAALEIRGIIDSIHSELKSYLNSHYNQYVPVVDMKMGLLESDGETSPSEKKYTLAMLGLGFSTAAAGVSSLFSGNPAAGINNFQTALFGASFGVQSTEPVSRLVQLGENKMSTSMFVTNELYNQLVTHYAGYLSEKALSRLSRLKNSGNTEAIADILFDELNDRARRYYEMYTEEVLGKLDEISDDTVGARYVNNALKVLEMSAELGVDGEHAIRAVKEAGERLGMLSEGVFVSVEDPLRTMADQIKTQDEYVTVLKDAVNAAIESYNSRMRELKIKDGVWSSMSQNHAAMLPWQFPSHQNYFPQQFPVTPPLQQASREVLPASLLAPAESHANVLPATAIGNHAPQKSHIPAGILLKPASAKKSTKGLPFVS